MIMKIFSTTVKNWFLLPYFLEAKQRQKYLKETIKELTPTNSTWNTSKKTTRVSLKASTVTHYHTSTLPIKSKCWKIKFTIAPVALITIGPFFFFLIFQASMLHNIRQEHYYKTYKMGTRTNACDAATDPRPYDSNNSFLYFLYKLFCSN